MSSNKRSVHGFRAKVVSGGILYSTQQTAATITRDPMTTVELALVMAGQKYVGRRGALMSPNGWMHSRDYPDTVLSVWSVRKRESRIIGGFFGA